MDVIGRSLKNLQVEISVGRHRWLADEPVGVGEDAGPSPYALLLGALAACKVMTCHLYANRKEWPLDAVEVTLNTRKEYARDCDDCASDPDAKVDIIECQITFEGNLDEAQLKRLTEISERCPVHRTLTSETKIRTTMREAQGVSVKSDT